MPVPRRLSRSLLLLGPGLLGLGLLASGNLGMGVLAEDKPPKAEPAKAAPTAAGPTASVVFETHIAPIFEARCVKCHGQGQTKAGLDVRRKFALLKGGDSGPALVPGKPGESLLIQRIEQKERPPPQEGRLEGRH